MTAETVTADPEVGESARNSDVDELCPHEALHGPTPWQDGQEWANALTHAIAAAATVFAGYYLVTAAASHGRGLAIACAAYAASVLGTFFFSTASHFIRRQPLLNILRSWDQAMIYAMISGTYTPIAYRYATETTQAPLLAAIWIAAAAGFLAKVALRHRINSIGAISYLLLGWLPAIPLAGQVPSELAWSMLAGGVVYTVGIALLMNDNKVKYLHAGWHISVMSAAAIHYLGILYYVVII